MSSVNYMEQGPMERSGLKLIERLREENRLVTEQNAKLNEGLLKSEREIERLKERITVLNFTVRSRKDEIRRLVRELNTAHSNDNYSFV
jgi:hypothetical protein